VSSPIENDIFIFLRISTFERILNMPHATATFNGKVIAETDKWEFVEGNIYVSPPSTGQLNHH